MLVFYFTYYFKIKVKNVNLQFTLNLLDGMIQIHTFSLNIDVRSLVIQFQLLTDIKRTFLIYKVSINIYIKDFKFPFSTFQIINLFFEHS